MDDSAAAWTETTKRGARSVEGPDVLHDEHGEVRVSAIESYGDTIHSFIERRGYDGAFLPGFQACPVPDPFARPAGLLHIDHTVGNVALGDMNRWVDFYCNVMGFSLYQHFDDKQITTEYSSLMSKVMANGNGRVKFLVNEPARGRRKSQIEEYLDYYEGPGDCSPPWQRTISFERLVSCGNRELSFSARPLLITRNCARGLASSTNRLTMLPVLGILADRDEGLSPSDFHPGPQPLMRLCSSKSFSGKAAAASARVILRPFSRPLNANRLRAGTSKPGPEDRRGTSFFGLY